ncbi:MAG: hypothetical protein KF836_08625 [Fimbriimonadaceae bacterium]|nr:hypothetical protein [Fimbriimonadaceae bacterium]
MMTNSAPRSDSGFPTIGTPNNPDTQAATEHLAAFERNTRELVDAQRIVLGGGEVGRV